ncbi:ankyrin repeat domain-containing protein [Paenibacillus sp. L3-i20]|uniref:ankyrin repeat domain-containing protein n=1 Tax=Paenibacillus sp. L3-i20 TaxID=2905833 RepID=UPI001EDF75AB|nr:ankyrin repeat domain-containing protein [Paenibacillus sp. L3-i20]
MKNEMLGAVKSKNLDKVKQLLEVDEELIDAKSEDDQTALLLAAYYHTHEVKELLLAKGANLNLYEAAAVGNTARIQEILRETPNLINSHSFDGYTPLGLAAHFGHEEAAAYLLDNGTDINLKGRDKTILIGMRRYIVSPPEYPQLISITSWTITLVC